MNSEDTFTYEKGTICIKHRGLEGHGRFFFFLMNINIFRPGDCSGSYILENNMKKLFIIALDKSFSKINVY